VTINFTVIEEGLEYIGKLGEDSKWMEQAWAELSVEKIDSDDQECKEIPKLKCKRVVQGRHPI
jgi:hypothetical protein